MWLLDANVPISLSEILTNFSVCVETTEQRGWKLLKNGELIEAAYLAGFRCIVTQDEDFRKMAVKYTNRFPELSIIWLRIPQAPWKTYREVFIAAWSIAPIRPIPGTSLNGLARVIIHKPDGDHDAWSFYMHHHNN